MKGVDEKTIAIAHIGDSYSSGTGAGNYDQSDPKAYRSANNWGSEYNKWLKNNGVSSTYLNLAQSGATTNRVIAEQIITVPTNTDLILMTIGGNDVDFGGIVQSCLAPYMARVKDCRDKINNANKKLPDVGKDTYRIFESLQSRLKNPNAQIVLVAYPLLSSWTDSLLMDCNHYLHFFCDWSSYYPAAKMVRELGFKATAEQQKIVDLWNSKNQIKVNFVAHTPIAFSNHEPATGSTINKQRWINFIGETDTVYHTLINTTIGRPTTTTEEYYHPGITGHQKIAELVQKQIGIPKSARNITPTSGDIDIAIIANSSTGERIPPYLTIRRNIFKVADPLRSRARSMNIFLAGYSFLPVSESTAHDLYDPFLDYDNLEDYHRISPGGGLQQDYNLNDAIYRALNENWRPGVKKIIIHLDKYWHSENDHLLWSTSPKYTNADIIKKAFEVDPVEIYSIGDNKSVHLADLMEITSGTGGFSIVNEDSVMTDDNISNEITKLVNHIASKPFAWLQGPYIVKIGEPITFDARGSYSSNGNIVKYEWDFNGDGIYDKTTTSGETTETFQSEHWGYMGVRVTDSTGLSSIGSTEFIISDDGDSTPRAIDNCPDVYNPTQTDTDGDGIGDECDPTHGVPDWLDGSQNPEALIDGLIMLKTDIPEYLELAYGSTDKYIESLITGGSTPEQIAATIKYLNLEISKESQEKLAQTTDNSGESSDNKDEDSSQESANKISDNQQNYNNIWIIITTSVLIIAVLITSGFIILKKHKKN